MQLAVLFLAALVSVYTQQLPVIPEILAHWKVLVAPYRNECICKTHVNPRLLDNLFTYGEFVDDACLKCAIKCFGMKLRIMDVSGRIDADRVHEILPYTNLEFAHSCANNSEPDICERAYKGIMCVFKRLGGQLSPNLNDELDEV